MKKIIAIASLLGTLLPGVAFAAPTSWDFAGTVLQPLQSQRSAQIKGSYFTSTSTSDNNTFPKLTGTSITGFNLSDCDAASNALTWNISTGLFGCNTISSVVASDNIATSSAETSGRIPFWTSTGATPALLSGGVAGFTFDSVLSKLTVTSAQITNGTTTNATSTNLSVSGNVDFDLLTSALLLTGANGDVAEYAGTSCTNQFTRSLSALGVATCATVTSSDVDSTIIKNTSVLNDLAQTNLADPGADRIVFWDDSDTEFDFLTTLTGITISGNTATVDDVICTGCLDAGVYAAASIDGDDINSNLAGRNLTLTSASPDTLDVDSEIYTFSVGANLVATTTASGIATTTENFVSIYIPIASTITNFNCYAKDTGTSTVRATIATNPLSAGSDILYTTGTRCGAQVHTSTSTFSTTAVSAGSWLRIYVSDAEPTGSRPRVIYPFFTLTKND